MRGGVVDYGEELLPHLARYCDIDIYTRDGLMATNQAIVDHFCIYGHREFLERHGKHPYDQVIYQLGCSADHVPDYEKLMQCPGWAVLHELNLGGIIGARTFERGRPYDYVKAVLSNEGIRAALSVTWRFIRTRQFPGYLEYDLSRQALLHSQGVIVHNQFMHQKIIERLKKWRARRPVHQVPMGMRPPPEISEAEIHRARQELGTEANTFVIGSFGVVHESKGILIALNAFKRLLTQFPNAIYVLVGHVEAKSAMALIQAQGLGGQVKLTGYVSMDNFYRYIAATDLCVNLRLPRTGGTSASLLRLMSVGRPVVISNQAQFTETPDSVCLKAESGDGAEDSIFGHMLNMATRPELAREIGTNAREYIAQHHSLERSAQAYWTALNRSPNSQE
jgi:glycosyltransferase involved in cell wall biosynthesis